MSYFTVDFTNKSKTLLGSVFFLLALVFDSYRSSLVSPKILDARKELCSLFFPAICHSGISWPQNSRSDFTLIKLQSIKGRALVSRHCGLGWRGIPQWARGSRFLTMSLLWCQCREHGYLLDRIWRERQRRWELGDSALPGIFSKHC